MRKCGIDRSTSKSKNKSVDAKRKWSSISWIYKLIYGLNKNIEQRLNLNSIFSVRIENRVSKMVIIGYKYQKMNVHILICIYLD